MGAAGVKRPRLHAITLWRPWPWAIFNADPPKWVENRSWWPRTDRLAPGAWLAIHAGVRWDQAAVAFINDRSTMPCPALDEDHPRGIVGVVQFRGWFRMIPETHHQEKLRAEVADSITYATGPLCWALGPEAVALPTPIHCDGQQGLWKVPEAVSAEIAAAMREAPA